MPKTVRWSKENSDLLNSLFGRLKAKRLRICGSTYGLWGMDEENQCVSMLNLPT